MKPAGLTFLKLGGSLLTVKSEAHTLRTGALDRIAGEIAGWLAGSEDQPLLLGHGSGSFGHVPASEHGTRAGVRDADGWAGFVEVWRAAADLNRLVMDALRRAGIRAVAFPPSAGAVAENGRIAGWSVEPIRAALDAGLTPVVYGDVAFDRAIGGTILSTEDLFEHLALALSPTRILVAGIEAGVWKNYPERDELIPVIARHDLRGQATGLGAAEGADVTGGMRGKVEALLALAERSPDAEVRIFGGLEPGSITRALAGDPLGTRVTSVDMRSPRV